MIAQEITTRAASAQSATNQKTPTVLEQFGGPMGFVYSTIPVIVFVVVNALLSLPLTLGIAVGSGLTLTVLRLARKEKLSTAIGSLLGVGLAAGIVVFTGSAKYLFVLGI